MAIGVTGDFVPLGSFKVIDGKDIGGALTGSVVSSSGIVYGSQFLSNGQNIGVEIGGTGINLSSNNRSTRLLGSSVYTTVAFTGSIISASDNLYASTSYAPAGDYNNVVLYDTATGKFYHTGSYGGGGAGEGFPFTGDAVITGSLEIVGTTGALTSSGILTDTAVFKFSSTSTGSITITSESIVGTVTENDRPPTDKTFELYSTDDQGILKLYSNNNAAITLDPQTNSTISSPNALFLNSSAVVLGSTSLPYIADNTNFQTNVLGGLWVTGSFGYAEGKIHATSLEIENSITASIISASGTIVGSNLSGTNTGDQDLSGYIQASQTSSMSVATASYVAGANVDGAVANATNADTASYILASNIDGTIDISDQTNLSNGTNTTVSGDAVNLNANITLTSVTASFQGDLEGTADQADNIKLVSVANDFEYHIPFVQFTSYPQLRKDSDSGLRFNPGISSLILDGNFTASGAISASGNLYGGLSVLNTTTVVTHQSSDGRLGTRSADSRIFGSTLVDYTGASPTNAVATFVDSDTIEGLASFTFDGTDVTIGGKSGTVTISTLGNITASGDISASGQIRAAQLGGQLNAGNITGTVDISSQTNLVGGTNLTLSGDTMNLDDNITLAGTATVVNLIADNNISGSGHLHASTSYAPAGNYNNVVLYDTATGKFYHTGSYGGGGAGEGFPFTGDAVITGSLEITAGTGTGAITASGAVSASGNLYGGLSTLSTDTVVTHQSSDGRLGTRTVDARIFGSSLVDYTSSPSANTLAKFVDSNTIEGLTNLTFDDEFLTIGGKSGTVKIDVSGSITASNAISASGTIVGSNLSGTNTGDQDLSGYILASQTSSMTVATAGTATSATSAVSSATLAIGVATDNVNKALIFVESNNTAGNRIAQQDQNENLHYNPSTTTLIVPNLSSSFITASVISASGNIYANTTNAGGAAYSTLMIDTTTGKFYHTGSYGGGGGATPTGPDYAVQFNDGGSLGGDSGFTYDNSSFADIKISDPTAAALHLSSSAGISRIQLTSATGQVNYIRHQRGTGNSVYTGVNSSGNYFIDDSTTGTTGIEFDVNSGVNSIRAKTIDTTDGIFLAVTASALTASNIYAPNLPSGVDNNVVILDSDGVLKKAEIDSRVWGSSLVDKLGTPVDNQVAVFSDSNTIGGSTGFTWDASTGTLEVGGKAGTAILSASGDISGSNNLYINRVYSDDLTLTGTFAWSTIPNITSNNFVVWNSKTGTLGYQVGTSRRETKYDINPISQELANGISELQPVTYIYKADEEKRTVGGFIAEEVAEVNPLFAKWGPNYKVNDSGSLDVRNIIDDTIIPSDIDDRTILAAAVAKIQQLEQEIKELKAKIT